MTRHPYRTLLIMVALLATVLFAQGADLHSGFHTPPDSARAWVYWFWLDGNVTRQAITADLEAMQRAGIRGVIIMEVDVWAPDGQVKFLSPEWRELHKFMLQEADRLGIVVDMNNDGGWCGSGGPWITPELSMQMLVSSEVQVTGPRHLALKLPAPKTNRDYYQDIALLAFPAQASDANRMADASPVFTYGPDRHPLNAANLTDRNAATIDTIPVPPSPGPRVLDITFPRPYTAESLTLSLDTIFSRVFGRLEVSDDGKTYRLLRPFSLMWPGSAINFDRVTARYYRVVFEPQPTIPPAPPPAAVPIVLGEVELSPARKVEAIAGKAVYINPEYYPNSGAGAAIPASLTLKRAKIQNITAHMDAGGHLVWDVPPGNWTLLRIGHTTTGKLNHPAPEGSLGLECDKLSRKAVDVQFAGLLGKLIGDQRTAGTHSLRYVHIDSWETGSQNWTPGFREEFQKRNGYDLVPFLPVLTGRAVESEEITERFLWDLRRTVGDMLLENYAGRFRELSHQNGMKLSIEAYGNGPLDDIPYAGRADLPMTEFWMGVEPWWVTRQMASAAHVYGQPILGAEAFTARSPAGRWLNHPFRMKSLGDQMFTQGINRYVIHRYAMQPWMGHAPGMSLGPYGIHFDRTNTWFEQSRAWLDYVARCQYLLQQGRFVADVAYLNSERIPNDMHEPLTMNLAVPPGYDYDSIPAEVLLNQTSVRDGRVTLASGMSYSVLLLPSSTTMRVAQLRKIHQLVADGATVVGGPPSKSPSLAEYPQGDAEIRRLAAELWGNTDGTNLTEHRLGKGRVVWGQPLSDLLRDSGLPADFTCAGMEVGKQIRYIHRAVDGRDVYFLSSAEAAAETFLCSFRVTGKRPELWHADSDRIAGAAVYEEAGRYTRIPIHLDPYGSVFVVFTTEPTTDRLASVTRGGVEVSGIKAIAPVDLRSKLNGLSIEADSGRYRLETSTPGAYRLNTAAGKVIAVDVPVLPEPLPVTGSWQLSFPKGWGAPEQVTLDHLISWTDHSNDGVRYFSGTATYRKQLDIPAAMLGPNQALYLDLGRVEVIAEVKLNGRDLGILWKAPFRVDITQAAHAGANDLEVRVVNLWPNRMIGDHELPSDVERNGTRLKAWPQWLLDGKPSPTGRYTFAMWDPWSKGDPLYDSGLLGPVKLESTFVAPGL